MPQKAETKEKEEKKVGKLAAVLIRGTANMNPKVKHTLKMLKLHRKNACVIVEDTPSYRGMLQRVNGAVAWGEVNEETVKDLKKERGEDKDFYRLHPPRGGFERKGIKMPYKKGGALGYRGDDMNELLRRML